MKPAGRLQGEGNRLADEVYREGARKFVEAGRVPAAAADAARSGNIRVDGSTPPAGDLDPLPGFWTEKQETSWDRVKEALRRDWLQTMQDLGLEGGADLGQSAGDTVKQVVGSEPIPNGASAGVTWDLARHAIRIGFGAATFWTDVAWTAAMEDRVRLEWLAVGSGIPFEQALPLIRHGWFVGRKDIT